MFLTKRNMGTLDRAIRIIVGLVLLLLGPVTNVIELTSLLNIILGVLGMIAIFSGIIGYCFLYELTGSDTRKNTGVTDN